MKIGIDARFYGARSKGLGRYTQKLIKYLEEGYLQNHFSDGKDDHFYIFLRKENYEEYKPKSENFHKVLADYKWYGFSEQFFYPRLLHKYKLDLVHFPHFNVPIFYRGKFVVTIHDLILLHFPTMRGTTLNFLTYWFKFFVYKIVIGKAIKNSRKIITVSNFTKKDILRNYSVRKSKVAVTYEACDNGTKNFSLDKKEATKILEKYGIIKPYLLYVGNAYPHKNLEKLLSAWRLITENGKYDDLRLVLVGKADYFYDRLRQFVKDNEIERVVFAGFVSDDDLEVVYNCAKSYIFPSLYEGFGLPPLEAMSFGVPVISSGHSCMREILDDAAYYFNAKDTNDILNAIEKIISDKELREVLREKGFRQFKKYNWSKMAEETLDIYKLI